MSRKAHVQKWKGFVYTTVDGTERLLDKRRIRYVKKDRRWYMYNVPNNYWSPIPSDMLPRIKRYDGKPLPDNGIFE